MTATICDVGGIASAEEPRLSSGMIEDLERLASDISALSDLASQLDDDPQVLYLNQLLCHLQWVLAELCGRRGILDGEMPWWSEWRSRGRRPHAGDPR